MVSGAMPPTSLPRPLPMVPASLPPTAPPTNPAAAAMAPSFADGAPVDSRTVAEGDLADLAGDVLRRRVGAAADGDEARSASRAQLKRARGTASEVSRSHGAGDLGDLQPGDGAAGALLGVVQERLPVSLRLVGPAVALLEDRDDGLDALSRRPVQRSCEPLRRACSLRRRPPSPPTGSHGAFARRQPCIRPPPPSWICRASRPRRRVTLSRRPTGTKNCLRIPPASCAGAARRCASRPTGSCRSVRAFQLLAGP